jgi:SAM-dependent methyltransferase
MEVARDSAPSALVRYLTAKRAVDDRALNRHVVDALRAHVPAGAPGRPVRVLEVGAGNGTMAARVAEWQLFRHADYVAVDGDAGAVADGWRSLAAWARGRGLDCAERGTGAERALRIGGPGGDEIAIRLVHADVLEFDPGARFDLLIANAFLDLVDIPAILPRLWRWVRPGGHFWFTINFDGETIFIPEEEPELERRILALYHRTMDERVVGGRRSGDSRSGRHLFGHLTDSGAEILAAGSSDWVVHPVGGRYPGEEAAFLHPIIDMVHEALRGRPVLEGDLDGERLAAWVETRRRQIDQGRLTYIAHQIDFFGRAPAGATGGEGA